MRATPAQTGATIIIIIRLLELGILAEFSSIASGSAGPWLMVRGV